MIPRNQAASPRPSSGACWTAAWSAARSAQIDVLSPRPTVPMPLLPSQGTPPGFGSGCRTGWPGLVTVIDASKSPLGLVVLAAPIPDAAQCDGLKQLHHDPPSSARTDFHDAAAGGSADLSELTSSGSTLISCRSRWWLSPRRFRGN